MCNDSGRTKTGLPPVHPDIKSGAHHLGSWYKLRSPKTYQLRFLHDHTAAILKHMDSRPPRGVLPENLGRGMQPASQDPYPIYDQNL